MPLVKQIETADGAGDLTRDLAEWAHRIRLVGNSAAHDSSATISPVDMPPPRPPYAALTGAMKAEYGSAPDRFRADMPAHRDDSSRRETRLILAVAGMAGLTIAVLAAGFAFLDILIGLPS